MKIYVTGLGVVSGIGIGVSENIEALQQGKHGIGKITLFPTALDVPVSEVKRSNEELKQLLSLPPQRTVSRTALLGMIAAKEAMEDAGLNLRISSNQPKNQLPNQSITSQKDQQPLRIGFISATSVGGMDLSERFYESFKKNPKQGRLREVISHDCGASTELIASYLGINDFITTISTACSSAANAIMLGARLIKHGQLNAVIVGGTDALCRFTLNGFNSLMILDKIHCRPFDRSRTGLNLGEGAGYLVLQSESSLQRVPYCELSGYANTNEAYHQTGSSPEGDVFTKWLKLKSTFGYDAKFWFADNFTPAYDWKPNPVEESSRYKSDNKSFTYLWDNYFVFDHTFAKKHRVGVMAGSSAQWNNYDYLNAQKNIFMFDNIHEMDNGEKMYSLGGSQSDWALLSLMARLNYSYEDKYLLTATVRRDGSSRFGKNNRWGTFPSVSLAWRVSQEDWFPKDNFLMNDLKLRVGYGVTGNQEIGNYGFVASYNTGVYPFGNNNSTALVSTTLSNPNIHWEEVRQANFGVDMSLFDSRVSLSLDAYIKNTNDMLVKASIPITSGFEDTTETFTNAGKMRNKGVEMTLRTINLKGIFSWESALTATYNKNEILDLNSETPMFINQIGNSYVTMLKAGYPINVFYGYVTDGLFQNWGEVNRHATQPGAAPGDIRFRDLNNDGVINDEDRTILGNPNPNWFFSLSNNLSYKGWELSVFLQGVAGNKIYNANNVDNEGMAAAYNQTTAVLNRWTGEGTSYSMPRAIWGDPNQNCRVSDRFVENGSYLRLKNITLSYTLPKKWLQKIQLENARISFSCENVATITGYSGFDPEVDVNGIDSSRYPISRTFSMGLNFNF